MSSTRLIAIILLVLFIVSPIIIVVVVIGPPLLVDIDGLNPPQRVEAINATRTTLVQVMAGVVLTVGLIFTALNLHVSREGQITDRFTKAIGQLGDERLPVRLGGIYALERVARDSVRDHPQIIETLCAFVREQSHSADRGKNSGGLMVDDRYLYTSDPAVVKRDIPTDIQAALRVLLRRKPGLPEYGPLDLRRADLRTADLTSANLRGALLVGALLESATLYRADLSYADLRGAQLGNADLTYARLDHTDLTGSNLRKARLVAVVGEWTRFSGAQLQEAELRNAVLPDATFDDAQLENANLILAYLESAGFSESSIARADLRGAYLHDAYLQNADLRGAQFQMHPPHSNHHLPSADLSGAILAGAKVGEANFYGVDLKGANLIGVDLSETRGLTHAQLDYAAAGVSRMPSNLAEDEPPPCETCQAPVDWKARAKRIRREAKGLL
jgi:uncharacterized protein YjbI with pentapeptide repeats